MGSYFRLNSFFKILFTFHAAMDSGFMDLSIYCVEMAPKWSNALDSQPRQGKEMSVQAYYDEFCIWKEKMEELNYLADEQSYIDDFLYGLKWDIAVRVWSYESKPQKLSVAFYWARIEESIIEIRALFAATSEPISMADDKLLSPIDSDLRTKSLYSSENDEQQNEACYVLDKMIDPVPTGLPSFSRPHVNEDEGYSLALEALVWLFEEQSLDSLPYKLKGVDAANQLFDKTRVNHLVEQTEENDDDNSTDQATHEGTLFFSTKINDPEVVCHMLDRMPKLISDEPNEEALTLIAMEDHELDDEIRFGQTLMFVFDPGGSTSRHMGCIASESNKNSVFLFSKLLVLMFGSGGGWNSRLHLVELDLKMLAEFRLKIVEVCLKPSSTARVEIVRSAVEHSDVGFAVFDDNVASKIIICTSVEQWKWKAMPFVSSKDLPERERKGKWDTSGLRDIVLFGPHGWLSLWCPQILTHTYSLYTFSGDIWFVFKSYVHLVDRSRHPLYTEDVFSGVSRFDVSIEGLFTCCSPMPQVSLIGFVNTHKSKLGYVPLEVHFEDMVCLIKDHKQRMACHVAAISYYMYMTTVHPYMPLRLTSFAALILTVKRMIGLMLWVLIFKLIFHMTRGRVIPWEGWNDENDSSMERNSTEFCDAFKLRPALRTMISIQEPSNITAAIDIAFVDRAVANAEACFSNVVEDVIAIRLETFIWDPGPCVVLLYILEDKDVFKRVGKETILMDTTLVVMGLINDAESLSKVEQPVVLDGMHSTAYALHITAANGQIEVICWLLNRSVNPDSLNRHKQTPWMLAAMHGNIMCVEILIEAGANVSITFTYDPAMLISINSSLKFRSITNGLYFTWLIVFFISLRTRMF